MSSIIEDGESEIVFNKKMFIINFYYIEVKTIFIYVFKYI